MPLPRRRWLLAALMPLLAVLPACGNSHKSGTSADPKTAKPAVATPSPSPTPPQLPRGGRRLLPDNRIVAFYGYPEGPGLGVLGRGTPEQAAEAIEKQAAGYIFTGRKVLPAMELIVTVAQAHPGPDGMYSLPEPDERVDAYLAAARKHHMLLILDFQPGQSRFLPQLQHYEKYIRMPDVGVALDAEWRMKPGQVPGKVFGSATAAEVNEASDYVAKIVKQDNLPQKLLVLHQFRLDMYPDRQAILPRDGLATTFHADGFGPTSEKIKVYGQLQLPGPPFHIGFKLFYKEDPDLMTPQQAMALQPQPDLITYQ